MSHKYGQAKHDWLKGFLRLPNGIPSHDTFGRFFAALDPEQFQACFAAWVAEVAEALGLKHVAIDGKTLRGFPRPQEGPGGVAPGQCLGRARVT